MEPDPDGRELEAPSLALPAVAAVRRRERRAAANTLAAAFLEDPLSQWIYSDDPRRPEWLVSDFRLRLSQFAGDHLTFQTAGGEGVAIWAGPGNWRGGWQAQFRAFSAVYRISRHHERINAVQSLLDARHPVPPHFYLALIGTHPSARGRKIGTALLQAGLKIADERGLPAYVEAGSERARDFYVNHGFRSRGEVQVSDAPAVYLLWRPAS